MTSTEMDERPELLDAMVADMNGKPELYQPGPYWKPKARVPQSWVR